MMKKYLIIAIGLVSIFLYSCGDDEIGINMKKEQPLDYTMWERYESHDGENYRDQYLISFREVTYYIYVYRQTDRDGDGKYDGKSDGTKLIYQEKGDFKYVSEDPIKVFMTALEVTDQTSTKEITRGRASVYELANKNTLESYPDRDTGIKYTYKYILE